MLSNWPTLIGSRFVHWHLPLQPEPQPSVGEIVTPPSRYRGPSDAVWIRLLHHLPVVYLYRLGRPRKKRWHQLAGPSAFLKKACGQLIDLETRTSDPT